MQPERCPAPYFKYNPSRRNSESGREVMATKDPDLEEPLELGQWSPLSLEGQQRTQRRRKRHPLLNHQYKSSANG